ncbi:hypothetical protein RFI_03155 [Reticulomyxa filosa]|uniref:Uncharacterized protein n=1 Tax=Reticulomyxa filosa TaxID=46433 RepID=X6P7A3_RETFI|nr:hypothetical protein RFI_03155 [Reticulomyxa filosa]|eukprot:ETO33939.1 hypothetical protein RFI_03155 [Reticulomyxa filosa]
MVLLAYQKVIKELVSANELQSHLKEAICSDSFIQNVNEQMRHLINAIEDQTEGNEKWYIVWMKQGNALKKINLRSLERRLLTQLNNVAGEEQAVLKNQREGEKGDSDSLLEKAANAFELPYEHVRLDKSFVNQIIGYFEKVRQKISYLFEKQRYQAFDEIKKFILVMDGLQIIGVIKQRTASKYCQIIDKISGFVMMYKKTLTQ